MAVQLYLGYPHTLGQRSKMRCLDNQIVWIIDTPPTMVKTHLKMVLTQYARDMLLWQQGKVSYLIVSGQGLDVYVGQLHNSLLKKIDTVTFALFGVVF